MAPARYLLAVLATTLACAALYLGLFLAQFGAPIQAEYWLRDALILKRRAAEQAGPGKLLVLGASSTIFGVDSPELERRLGRPVVNFGLHASFPLSYLTDLAGRHVLPGDVVLLPLEYEFYSRGNAYSTWFIRQMIAWNHAHFREMPLAERFRLVTRYRPSRIFRTLLIKARAERVYAARPARRLRSEEAVIAEAERIWASGDHRPGYGIENLNRHGDAVLSPGVFAGRGSDYHLRAGLRFHPAAARTLLEFSELCRRRGARLIVTWPPAMLGGKRHVRGETAQRALAMIGARLREMGIETAGSPEDFFYERELFYDSPYHLNAEGRRRRTHALLEALGPLLAPL